MLVVSVCSGEEELGGGNRELEVWGNGETGEGVSWKLRFDEFGGVWKVG